MARRPRHAMPDAIRAALSKAGLAKAYADRPAYQRNDYLGWIASAKGEATKDRRLAKMLQELERGGIYMGMKHGPSARG